MVVDTQSFISACPVYGQNKSPKIALGQLISLDFVIGLPFSHYYFVSGFLKSI